MSVGPLESATAALSSIPGANISTALSSAPDLINTPGLALGVSQSNSPDMSAVAQATAHAVKLFGSADSLSTIASGQTGAYTDPAHATLGTIA